MDSKFLRVVYIFLALAVLFMFCGCGEIQPKQEPEDFVFVSKTIEGASILVVGTMPANATIHTDVLDEAFDKILGDYTLYELATDCDRTVRDLKGYFNLANLEFNLEVGTDSTRIWPGSSPCPLIATKPEI